MHEIPTLLVLIAFLLLVEWVSQHHCGFNPSAMEGADVSTEAEASLPRLSSIQPPLEVKQGAFYLNEGYYLDSAIHSMTPEKISYRLF